MSEWLKEHAAAAGRSPRAVRDRVRTRRTAIWRNRRIASADSWTRHEFGRHPLERFNVVGFEPQTFNVFHSRWSAEHTDLQHGFIALELGAAAKLIDVELGGHSMRVTPASPPHGRPTHRASG